MSTLDTVRFDLEPSSWVGSAPPGWRDIQGARREITALDRSDTQYRVLQDLETGLRVGGTCDHARWVETSLPRLLHPSNGILLKPSEMPASVSRLRNLLALAAPDAALGQMTRADLVLHFRMDPDDAIQAFRGIPHPKVRRAAREFFGTGLEWPGDHVHIRFYDKLREMEQRRGDIMRLEFQLRGRKQLPAIWDGSAFDMVTAHLFYRRLALGFEPRSLSRPSDLVGFLAWLERNAGTVKGQRPLDVYLAMKKPEYGRQLRASVRRASVPELVLDFRELLEPDSLPDFIDCYPTPKPVLQVA